jgi:hypothetical protein
LPTAIRLRRYQKPPARNNGPSQRAAVARRRVRGAIAITPTVRAKTAASTVSFTPTANPAATAASTSDPLTSSPTDPSRKKIATTSLAAAPACE